MKTCSKCGVEQPLDQFYVDRRRGHRVAHCRSCKVAYNKARLADPEKRSAHAAYQREWRLKNLYGDDVLGWLKDRESCEVCGSTEDLRVDHEHFSGQRRGVLCHPCNVAEGLLKSDPARMRALAEYVERHAERIYKELVA